MFRFVTSLLCFLILASQPAIAQKSEQGKLKEIETERATETAKAAELEKSRMSVQKEIAGLQSDMTHLAAEVRALQSDENRLLSEIKRLETTAEWLRELIVSDQTRLTKILAGLQRVEINPPPALFMSPNDAKTSIQAATLMRGLNAQMTDRVTSLKTDLAELRSVQADIEIERKSITKTRSQLATKQSTLRSAVSKKTDLEKSISSDLKATQARANKLAKEADSLKDLIRKLELQARKVTPDTNRGNSGSLTIEDIIPRIKPKPGVDAPLPALDPDTFRFADARGKLEPPVDGRVSKTYSSKHQGYLVATTSEAQVTAPYAGRIEFSGNFKNYDKIVILNMGDGYFMLMTGLGEIYTQTGSHVAVGEPVGLMPFNTQNSTNLYIEIRKDGSPVNPNPWLGTAFARQG